VAGVNNTWLYVRLLNELKEGSFLTFKNNEWHVKDLENNEII